MQENLLIEKDVIDENALFSHKSEAQKKNEYYLSIHNKIKVEYRNKQYKAVFEKLNNLDQPKQLLHLYYEDLIIARNKLLKQIIIHKQITFKNKQIYELIYTGKSTIRKLYKMFITNDSFTGSKVVVNKQMEKSIVRFFIAILGFIIKIAYIYHSQEKIKEAAHLYEVTYEMCVKIFQSSTHSYTLLRKVGQFVVSYCRFLLQNGFVDKALLIYKNGLLNEINVLLLLNFNRNKQKSLTKKRKIQTLDRLFVYFFNISNCFRVKQMYHFSYIYLRECKSIAQFKKIISHKQSKVKWQQILKNYRKSFEAHSQLTRISQSYFNCIEIQHEKLTKPLKVQIEEQFDEFNGKSAKTTFTQLNSKNSHPYLNSKQKSRRQFSIKRSVSLQDNLVDNQKNMALYNQFGKDILFYGVNFTEQETKVKKSTFSLTKSITQSRQPNKQPKLSQFSKQTKYNPNQQINKTSKLQKKNVKGANLLFKKINEPQQYEQLKQKVQNLWKQQQIQAHKFKEKVTLLKYKSNYLNYKQISKENKNLHTQIKVIDKKDNVFERKSDKKNHHEEQEEKQKDKDKGMNLLKKLILKHSKTFEIKKSQTINILKRRNKQQNNPKQNISLKRRKKQQHNSKQIISYSTPEESITFLLDKLAKEKVKYRFSQQNDSDLQDPRQNEQQNRHNKLFLTSDNKKRKLFLSYIASPTAVNERIENVLIYKTLTRLAS